MAQQAAFTKLKEQIEAAKRGLTEMSNAEIATSRGNQLPASPHGFLASVSPKIIEPDKAKAILSDVSCSDTNVAQAAGITPETVPEDRPIDDYTSGNVEVERAGEFQFFHRVKQPKGSRDLPLDVSSEETGSFSDEAEVLLLERLGSRLTSLEGGVEQNRKYILELINLLSQLDLRQEPANRKIRSLQPRNRRHMFWLLISLLVIGWFCLTPSGHVAIQRFLTYI